MKVRMWQETLWDLIWKIIILCSLLIKQIKDSELPECILMCWNDDDISFYTNFIQYQKVITLLMVEEWIFLQPDWNNRWLGLNEKTKERVKACRGERLQLNTLTPKLKCMTKQMKPLVDGNVKKSIFLLISCGKETPKCFRCIHLWTFSYLDYGCQKTFLSNVPILCIVVLHTSILSNSDSS